MYMQRIGKLSMFFRMEEVCVFADMLHHPQYPEATSTSPLYSAFTQILEGLVTVRAFAAEHYFMEQMQTITAITSAQWWAICTMEVRD